MLLLRTTSERMQVLGSFTSVLKPPLRTLCFPRPWKCPPHTTPQDPLLPKTLEMLRCSGRKVFLATNRYERKYNTRPHSLY